MSAKIDYQRGLQQELHDWKAEIARLAIRVELADSHAQAQFDRQLKELHDQRDAAERRLAELEAADEGNWQNLKGAVDKTWHDLGEAVKVASAMLRDQP